MADPAAWRELRLMQRVAACLAAARRHPRFPELHDHAAVAPLLRLAADRLVACPAELEAGLPALLDGLAIPAGSSSSSASSNSGSSGAAAGSSAQQGGAAAALAAAAAAELAPGAAAALASQLSSPSAGRWLWAEVHARLLPVAAEQLEGQQVALARAARALGGNATEAAAQLPPQQLYRIMLPCQLLYFYVLEAPRQGPGAGGEQLQAALLKGGLLRSLVLLFIQLGSSPGAEPLRCALLLACAAVQSLTDWAAAVPGFAAAVRGPALAAGGEAALHGALWSLLLGGGGAELAALLGDATPADKVPGVYQALQLMADMQAVSRRPAPLWGGEVEGALRALTDTLRQHYSRQRKEEAEVEGAAAAGAAATEAGAERAAAGGLSSSAGEDEGGADDDAADTADRKAAEREAAEEAHKLGRPAEEQAALLAARRAARLQPACLKLIKELLQRQAGSGAGKHD